MYFEMGTRHAVSPFCRDLSRQLIKPFSLQCQFDYAEKRHCDRGGETKLQRGHQD